MRLSAVATLAGLLPLLASAVSSTDEYQDAVCLLSCSLCSKAWLGIRSGWGLGLVGDQWADGKVRIHRTRATCPTIISIPPSWAPTSTPGPRPSTPTRVFL